MGWGLCVSSGVRGFGAGRGGGEAVRSQGQDRTKVFPGEFQHCHRAACGSVSLLRLSKQIVESRMSVSPLSILPALLQATLLAWSTYLAHALPYLQRVSKLLTLNPKTRLNWTRELDGSSWVPS